MLTSLSPSEAEHSAALSLLSSAAVRERSAEMLEVALRGDLAEFTVDLDRLPAIADAVVGTIRANYPSLKIPFHARWRHFVFQGRDLWAELQQRATFTDKTARARSRFDLAIVSVLLDAGAGATWRYRDQATGLTIGRSEGLALASLRMFEQGLFSNDLSDPLRADADRLATLELDELADAFQIGESNTMTGLDGRHRLLQQLGTSALANSASFAGADSARPGGLFDAIIRQADQNRIAAPDILRELLLALGPIWPGRHQLAGISLGDCWKHATIRRDDSTDGLIPFHKLSQWMAYSLVEPLEQAGFTVTDADGLTGLAEYRNGGLFIDLGAIVPRDPAILNAQHAADSAIVVAWRALTVALLDQLAPLVRERLGVSAEQFPLACLLEGGTWATGRAVAASRRADGGPQLAIQADGTVF
ncbi:hypothetical protein GJW-30_1_04013 [Variibacter gotjawalensis]|uniref:Uracil phosphoribosyltransferase n=1 Tax=Variibacter gotjawalensis TaxID=1333996 RepID=A0A0S3Q0F9_9BRAD|nr:URC4/urg3 family protein [Variibacter gotjawalensis]RZS49194.1 uncharacterized protein DUF1688 [Variibacter gotjawalensis]BAT61456.1 hypothetical protein GJW-30_1_04013 [Variibacter gotjawalensis]